MTLTLPRDAAPSYVSLNDGVALTVASCVNDRDEVETTMRWLVAARDDGLRWRELLVVAPGKRKWRERLAMALDAAAIPHRMLLGDPDADPDDADAAGDAVAVTSLYGAEGLSRPCVAIVGLGDLPWKQQPLDEAVRIVTAAFAVATVRLHVARSRDSSLIERVFAAPPDPYIARK